MIADIASIYRLAGLQRHLFRVCITFLLGVYAGTLWAATASKVVTTEHMSAQLVAEHQELIPGKASSIALKLNHRPQWHSYWRTPGDSGLPTQIKWDVPAGVNMGAIQWPAPKWLPFGPLMNFGYEGETWLISEITLSPDYAKPSVTLSGHVEWLVCNDVCIPEEGHLTLTLPVGFRASGNGFLDQGCGCCNYVNSWPFRCLQRSYGSSGCWASSRG